MKCSKKSPRVSIIVPVYNIEPFLKRCVDSLIEQTYKNIEILLVDDGSTDKSEQICDDYQIVDARITVIHKRNGGLSDARNVGIEYAKGQYITFVDGDDYISECYVEYLLNLLLSRNAQISICEHKEVYTIEPQFDKFTQVASDVKIYSGKEALVELLYQRNVSTSICGKLFCISLFDTLRFPNGVLYEDLAICCELYMNVETVAVSDARMYGYYQRSDSIIHNSFSQANLDLLTISEQIISKVENQSKCLENAAKTRQFSSCCSVLRLLLDSSCDRYVKEQIQIWLKIKELRTIVILDKNSRFKNKVAAFFTLFGKWIFCNFALKVYRGTMSKLN